MEYIPLVVIGVLAIAAFLFLLARHNRLGSDLQARTDKIHDKLDIIKKDVEAKVDQIKDKIK